MQAPVALGIGVRLIPGVDNRAGAGRSARNWFPDVLRPLAEAEGGTVGSLEDLPGPGIDLPTHQEGDQDLRIFGQVLPTIRQVVLMATVGVPGRVSVVLE